jgi:antibiotic biosynthesis monooxygenase (ABM) superfamily enzyme
MTRSAQLKFLSAAILGAYLVINALMLALGPLTRGLPQLGMTAVIVPPMVLAMVYLVIPAARRASHGSTNAANTRAQA